MGRHSLGFGKIELIVGIACLIIVLVVAITVLRASQPGSVWPESDVTKMRGIHQAMLVFAGEFEGQLPTPSVAAAEGIHTPDPTHDTTANMYSFMVIQNYVAPDVLVSDRDPNEHVRVYEPTDVWEGFEPSVPWANNFQADLDRISHVSYAHMLMFGERFDRYWRETTADDIPVIGNRGPAEGARDRFSLTTDANGRWTGYVIAGDHSSQLQTSMTPSWLTFGEAPPQPDNLFAIDDGLHGRDVVLTFTKSNSPGGTELQHD